LFSNHLFWTGAVTEAWSLIEAELAKLGPAQTSGHAATLATRGSMIAWFRGDNERALRYAERGLAAARRSGDATAEQYARHGLAHIRYAINGNRQAAAEAFSESAASGRALGSKIAEATGWRIWLATAAAPCCTLSPASGRLSRPAHPPRSRNCRCFVV